MEDFIRVGEWVGPNIQQKMEVRCPECGKVQEILWFPPKRMNYRQKGTTGGSGFASASRVEKVIGNCEKCGYKFKLDDLD